MTIERGNDAVLTTDQLRAQLQLTEPSSQVRVEGKVLSVREWAKDGKRVKWFVTIVGAAPNSAKLELMLEPDVIVLRGEIIRAVGTLKIMAEDDGIKLRLTAVIEARFTTASHAPTSFIRTRQKQQLRDFMRALVRGHELIGFFAIATEVGKADFLSAMTHWKLPGRVMPWFEAMNDRVRILEVLRKAAGEPRCLGLFILRGGGDNLSDLWSDDWEICQAIADFPKPIYTALGHAKDIQVADKLADESFASPGIIGERWAHAFFQATCAPEQSLDNYAKAALIAFALLVLLWLALR